MAEQLRQYVAASQIKSAGCWNSLHNISHHKTYLLLIGFLLLLGFLAQSVQLLRTELQLE